MADKKFIITIGRQFGSGGHDIGKKLAEKLGIKFYDKELLLEAAKEAGLNPALFKKADEKLPSFYLSNLSMNIGFYMHQFSPSASYYDSVQKAICDMIRTVAERESCIIVGRCADYLLRDNPRCINIFISASQDACAERIVKRMDGMTIDDIVVFVILDGREKMDESIFQFRQDTKHYLTEEDAKVMDVAIEDNRRRTKAWKRHMAVLRTKYSERDVIALTKRIPMLQLHLFKCNRLISKGSIANESYYTPFDIIFAVKENNMGKLNSHLWIMRGFARQLNPDFITLLDVGTKVFIHPFPSLH